MNSSTARLVNRIELRQQQRLQNKAASTRESGVDEQLRSYRMAAAVLDCFRVMDLRPLESRFVHSNPISLLFEDIIPASGRKDQGYFTLKLPIRREALRELSTPATMRQALEANPDRLLTPMQSDWERFLSRPEPPPLDSMKYNDLARLCQIAKWVQGLSSFALDVEEVERAMRHASVFEAFEHLVGDHFTGREGELATLRAHIGTLPPKGFVAEAAGKIATVLGVGLRPLLFIHGPGGIGKSALLGQFLLENLQKASADRVLFAYLAFDQPTLRISEPSTLLIEAARYLELQVPQEASAFETFRQSLRNLQSGRREINVGKAGSRSRSERISNVRQMDYHLYDGFAKLLSQCAKSLATKPERPIALVFDTFEEVQYADRENLGGFWRMLAHIQSLYPPVKYIISGRSAITDSQDLPIAMRELLLPDLPMTVSITLLQKLGVVDAELAQAVVEQVGGNPFSLRLAARIIKDEPESVQRGQGISGINTRKWFLFQVDQALIQGQLYRRFLNHIHNEKIRNLAHPGMVLRKVSPEIILKVLAPVCRVEVNGLQEAEDLFEELGKEYALVRQGTAGLIEYRPEVRSAVIRLLEKDQPEQVRDLRRAAIRYYEGQTGIESRAEEMFHRLALFEDPVWELNQRWMRGIESSVASGMAEFRDEAKAWLASRMDLEVPREVFEKAATAEWERNITRKVQRALSHLDSTGAEQLLHERQDRTIDSPLFALEAKTYLLMQDYPRAAKILESGIESATLSQNEGRLAELFWLRSQVALLDSIPDALLADEMLARAERVMQGDPSGVGLAQIIAQRLVLRDERFEIRGQRPIGAHDELRANLIKVAERIPEHAAYNAVFVLKLILFFLKDFPRVAERIRGFLPPDSGEELNWDLIVQRLTSENLVGLESYRQSWETDETTPSEALA